MSFAFKRGLGPRISSPLGPKMNKWLRFCFFLVGAKKSDFWHYRARESVGAREHRSESGHPLRSQFWKISESVRDKMYVPESGSPIGSQLGDHRNF